MILHICHWKLELRWGNTREQSTVSSGDLEQMVLLEPNRTIKIVVNNTDMYAQAYFLIMILRSRWCYNVTPAFR